jgi:hypothetical protein
MRFRRRVVHCSTTYPLHPEIRSLNRVRKPQARRMPWSGAIGELTKVPLAQVLEQTPPPNLNLDPLFGLRSANAASDQMDPDLHDLLGPLPLPQECGRMASWAFRSRRSRPASARIALW